MTEKDKLSNEKIQPLNDESLEEVNGGMLDGMIMLDDNKATKIVEDAKMAASKKKSANNGKNTIDLLDSNMEKEWLLL